MEPSVLAIIEINFLVNETHREEIEMIEKLLRGTEGARNLLVSEQAVTFYLWGKEKIDYGILDEIKKELNNARFSAFTIFASEYLKTEKKCYYNGAAKTNPSIEG